MHESSLLAQAVLLFGAALVIGWMFRVLRAPTAIGFLMSGLFIGPSGLQLITAEGVQRFADLGLVMLLFTIGLELSPEPLIRAGRPMVMAAAAQILLTAFIAFVVFKLIQPSYGRAAGILISAAIALSSSAIALKQLLESGQTTTSAGTLMVGILLLQDLFVILLMLFLPLFALTGETSWQGAAFRGVVSAASLAVVTLVARYCIPLFLRLVVRWGGRDLITLFALVAALAGAWVASLAGWSPPLGACIVGLILSQTDLRHQLSAEIMPFRDVLNALFFISMGMLVDLGAIREGFEIICVLVVASLVGKTLISTFVIRAAGFPLRLAVHAGIGLCTVSEFSYVLAADAGRLGILPQALFSDFTAYIVGTMIIGAMAFPLAGKASTAICKVFGNEDAPSPAAAEHAELSGHVIIVGFGLNGQNLARVLTAANIPFCIIEMNPALAEQAREAKYRVIQGDATRRIILLHAGLAMARALVVAINDQEATRRIVAQARDARHDLYILARTRYTSELEPLHRLGAQDVIPEEFETSIEIFAHVLNHFGVPENVIDAQIMLIRSGNYGVLRGRQFSAGQRVDVMKVLESTTTQTVFIDEASPARGATLRELDLRAKTGATIIAVVRKGQAMTNPASDFVIEASDLLVLLGGHKQLESAKQLLSPATA